MRHTTYNQRRIKSLLIATGFGLSALLYAGCSSSSSTTAQSSCPANQTGAPSADGKFHMRPCTTVAGS